MRWNGIDTGSDAVTSARPSESAMIGRWLRASAGLVAAWCAATAIVLWLRGLSGIPVYYFYAQDARLLILGAVVLMLISRLPAANACPMPVSEYHVAMMVGAAAAVAYAGTWLVMMRYPMSRDEALAHFASEHLQHGLLGWPIPDNLRPLARALMPVWAGRWMPSGYWVSDYLPVNAALRAAFGWLGDSWLAGPFLLVIGMAALWSAARRLWPETAEAAIVAVVLAVTSAQLVVTAMTPYAMTAHFALNALWLAAFLRGGRRGHTLAITVGLLASGLHQFHFHLMFISGFMLWAWLSGRRKVAVIYAVAAIGYHVFWHDLYIRLMVASLGPISGGIEPPLAGSWLLARLHRLNQLEPFSSLARFAAWQNVLLLPLAALGTVRLRLRHNAALPIAFALQVSCVVGLSVMLYQGFGYGYRYLSGTMPCFVLLAAGGWMRLKREHADAMPWALLLASVAFAVLVTLPFTIWQSHRLLRPYAESFRAARSAPADVVLVDGRGGGLLQDIVRVDGAIGRPLLLDLAYVPPALLRDLCAQKRVMLFDQRQAQALGVMGTGMGDQPGYRRMAARQRARIARWRCDTPVPIEPRA